MAAALSASYGQTQPTGANLADTVYVEYSDTLRMLALYQSKAAPGDRAHRADPSGRRAASSAFLQPGFANTGGPAGLRAASSTQATLVRSQPDARPRRLHDHRGRA